MRGDSIKFLAFVLTIAIASSGCFKSKNVVTKVGSANRGSSRLDGVPYALPRTVIQAQVPFKRRDKVKGEFEQYAPCFFPRDIAADRVRSNTTAFSIGAPTLGSRGEPDPNEHYLAKIKGGYFEKKTLFLEFNPDGVITKGEASSTNVAVDVLIGALRTGISVAASAAAPAAAAPGEAANVAANRAKVEEAELNSLVQICQATVVAEAALEAAEAAVAAVKAASLPAEPNAQNAKNRAARIEQNLAAHQTEIVDLLATLKADLSVNISATLTNLQNEASDLVDQVFCDAKEVRTYVLAAAAAAAAAPEEAAAATNAANRITPIITITGLVDSATHMSAPYSTCYKQVEDPNEPARAKAFANGYFRAREKFLRISELKARRENFSNGIVAQGLSAEALQKLIDDQDNTINSYQNTFFLGTVQEDNWTADFEFRPGRTRFATNSLIVPTSYNTTQTSPVLIWFSKTKGLCASTETTTQGVQIKQTFKADTCPLTAADAARAIWIGIDRLQSETDYLQQIATSNERDERRGERGFYYRVPAQALVKIILSDLNAANAATLDANSASGTNWNPATPPPAGALLIPVGPELGRNRIKIAQLGIVASLPASAAGRTTQYTLDFDETTGALKNFRLASNALLEKSVVEEAGAAATDVVAAKQAREKASKEANDELNKKKRELELLQLQNQINEERKKLEAAQPATTPQPQ